MIYKAVQENNLPLVRYLAMKGANVKVRAEDGMNAVHVACQNGNLEMIQFLVHIFNFNLLLLK